MQYRFETLSFDGTKTWEYYDFTI